MKDGFKAVSRCPDLPHVVARLCDANGFSEISCDRCGMVAQFSPSVSSDEFERSVVAFGMHHKDCQDRYGVLDAEILKPNTPTGEEIV